MRLTKHSHYLLLVIGLIVFNPLIQNLGGAVMGAPGRFVASAMVGFGVIVVIITWVSFGISNKKSIQKNNEGIQK